LRDKWLWYTIVHRICKEFNYNATEVLKMNIIECLENISYLHELEEYNNLKSEEARGKKRIL
jgi:hypothetical protein